MTLTSNSLDLQSTSPSIALTLDKVGVVGVTRGIVISQWNAPTTATFDISTIVSADTRGAHLSRFHESLDQALSLVGDDAQAVPSLAVLAAVIATRAADLQQATKAHAYARATVVLPRVSPASGKRTIDPFDTWAAVEIDRSAGAPRTVTTIGVEVVGMTACPCAQNLVRDAARNRLISDGLSESVIEQALTVIPVATHNQKSTGRIEISLSSDAAVTEFVDPLLLVDIVRQSMSADIHELLKRTDECEVVETAHANPKFAEDCVRDLILNMIKHPDIGGSLPVHTLISATQINHESIHVHDVIAQKSGQLGELSQQLEVLSSPNPA